MPYRDDDAEQPEQLGSPSTDTDPAEEERVGYKRPPKHSRFPKGRSGNPAGRPRGSLNRSTVEAMAAEVWIDETMKVIEGGRERHVPRLSALMKKQAELAFKGDRKAIMDCFALVLRLGGDAPEPRSGDETPDEDEAILRTHHLALRHAAGPTTIVSPDDEEDDRD